MLKNGFEEFTIELTPSEIPKVNRIAAGLRALKGKENAMTNKEIRKRLANKGEMILGDAEFRKIVQYIRQNNVVPRLCSTGKGYYVAQNDEEWSEWVQSYRSRTNAMIYTLKCAIQDQTVMDFNSNDLKKI